MRLLLLSILAITFSAYGQTFDWIQIIQQGGNNYVWDMTSMSDGSVIATGRVKFDCVFGRGSTSQPSAAIGAQTDVFLVKFNPDSTLAWGRRMGGIYPDWGRGVTLDNDNNIYVTGDFVNIAVFENDTIYGYDNGSADVNLMARSGFVAKYSPDGDLIWVEKFQGTGHCRGYSVTVDDFGNAYVTGMITGLTDFDGHITGENNTYQYGFIAKYNSAGNCIWSYYLDGQYGSLGNEIRSVTEHKIILTGYYKGTLAYSGNSYPGGSPSWGSMFTMLVDSTGDLIWNQTATSSYLVSGNGITFDEGENVYVSGVFSQTTNFDGQIVTYTGTGVTAADIINNADGFVVKYSAAGELIWLQTFENEVSLVGLEKIWFDKDQVFIAGQITDTLFFNGTADTLVVPNNSPSSLILCLDSSGIYKWSKVIPGTGPSPQNYSRSIVTDAHRNIYVSGSYEEQATWDSQFIYSGTGFDGYMTKLFPLLEPELFANVSYCEGDTVLVTALVAGYPYTSNWQISSGAIYQQTTDSLWIILPSSGATTDTVYFVVDNGYEVDSVMYVIAITDSLNVTLGNDTTLCEGETILLDAGSAGYYFDWGTGFILDDSTLMVASTGLYNVNVTNGSNCTASDSIMVSFIESPVVILGPDQLRCDYDSVLLETGSLGDFVDWGSGQTLNDTTHYVYDTGEYIVTVQNSNGCTGQDTIQFTFTDCLGTEELNAFHQLIFYPNPFADQVTINFQNPESIGAELKISSLSGDLVLTSTMNSANNILDLSALSQGIYYAEFLFEDGTIKVIPICKL